MRGLKKLLSGLGLAAGLTLSAASPATTITNTDGTFAFTGFDWAQGGTAFTTGFSGVPGDTFTLTFFSWAVALQNPATFVPAGLDFDANGAPGGANGAGTAYEYTVVATLDETFLGCVLVFGTQVCSFAINSGSYNIWYDTSPDANSTAGSLGTGFTDGALLLSGTVPSQFGGNFNIIPPGDGSGNASLIGTVDFTNLAFINPNLSGTNAVATLQFGNLQTNYTDPNGFGGVAFAGPPEFHGQADGNQSFFTPEPATLALLGIGLLGLGALRRRQ